ncbi:DUF5666 domain-containing protein [Nocardia arizonensis]|uniref:DUF5666 domain-containing protein n=1 Tax=Nocardia arizonensis TaxID=1141647 RepID=UPI0006D16401|nr:DUF5666 domain-containing protein [Nocardia arizonensis]
MSTPKDPWAQRPDDAPTQYLGPQGQPGQDGPTQHLGHGHPGYGQGVADDPTVAYGKGGASAHPPATEQFAPWTPPPVNPTQQLPTYENEWGAGAYDGAYGNGGYDGYGQQWSGSPGRPGGIPPGAPPPYDRPPGDQPPRKRNTGLWIALALGVIALVAVGGVAAGVLLGGKDSDSTAAGATTTRSFPATGQQRPSTQAPSKSASPTLPGVPGVPGLDGLGATMGTISANNGGTLTLSTLSGETVTVRTTDKTQVISLSGAKASDLPVGDVVMVQGDKSGDGTIQAKVIISTGLPGGPR